MTTSSGGPQPAVPTLRRESLRPVYIEMMYCPEGRDATPESEVIMMAKGTGFFYRVDDRLFLVTARHNFSGKHWENGKFLNKNYSAAPTHVAVGFRSQSPTKFNSTGWTVPVQQYLLNLIDVAWQPVWLEHPRFSTSIDIAALEFTQPQEQGDVILDAWDEAPAASDPRSKLWVSQDISVVGFPYGLRGSFDLPIWIGGTIASEPALLHEYRGKQYPLFLVSAATRSGQSGSPVLTVRQPGCATIEDGAVRAGIGPRWDLVGVYTGRVPEDYDAKEGSAFGAELPPEAPTKPQIDYGEEIPEVDPQVTQRLADLNRRLERVTRKAKQSSDLGFVWRIQEATEICRSGVRGESGLIDADPADRNIPTTGSGQNE